MYIGWNNSGVDMAIKVIKKINNKLKFLNKFLNIEFEETSL